MVTLIPRDLASLGGWIAASKMQVNVEKSSVMWFSVKSPKSSTVHGATNFAGR